MKTKRTLTIAAVLIALTFVTLGIFRGMQSVRAQDTAPPQPERISFGMVGFTQGQTIRLTVSDTIAPNDSGWPPGPTRVVLNFRLPNGQLVRDRNGEVIRKVTDLERGTSTFLDVDFDQWPPGPVRVQLRAVVTLQAPFVKDSTEVSPPVANRIGATVEVINNANGRTAFVLSKDPGYRQEPPPMGD
jgi:hypothetical protein